MDAIFETERLLARKFRAEDAQRLYKNHLDENVKKWFPNESYADVNEAKEAIAFYRDCVNSNRFPFVFAVQLKETGELIRDTGVSEVEGKPGEVGAGLSLVLRRLPVRHRVFPGGRRARRLRPPVLLPMGKFVYPRWAGRPRYPDP